MFNIGTQELLIILVMALLLFGAKRVPEVARSFGKGLHDFRDAMSGLEREFKNEAFGMGDPKTPPTLTPPMRPPVASGQGPGWRSAKRLGEGVAPASGTTESGTDSSGAWSSGPRPGDVPRDGALEDSAPRVLPKEGEV